MSTPLTPEQRIKFKLPPRHFGRGLEKGDTIHVYTPEEWGIGASNPGGGNYQTRSLFVMVIITIVMAPAATAAWIFFLLCVFSLNPLALFMLLLTAVFGAGAYVGVSTCIDEWKARKLRKIKGLPKPWFGVTDDHAYEWFLKNPHPEVEMTLEYFPNSYKLQNEAKWEARRNGKADGG